MTAWELVLRELRHRPVSAVMTVLAVAAAAAVVHVFVLLARAGADQTRVIQRDIGLNVLVLPVETDLSRYWARGHSEFDLPETYVKRLADQDVANRLVPMLRRRVAWGQGEVLLTGISEEVFRRGQTKRAVFGRSIADGVLVAGAVAAELVGAAAGERVTLLGEEFTVERVLAPVGGAEDVTVYANLPAVQRVLGLPGRINEIAALECHCEEPGEDPLALLRATLEPLLPGTMVVRRALAADARRRQRLLADGTLELATHVLAWLAAVVVAALTALNVHQRRREIGVLVALGRGPGALATLMLGRAALLGALGAALGGWVAAPLARGVAVELQVGAARITPGPGALLLGLAITVACAVVAALPPIVLAATRPVAEVLRDG